MTSTTESNDPLAVYNELCLAGEAPNLDQFCARYPEHPSLRERIQVLGKLQQDLQRLVSIPEPEPDAPVGTAIAGSFGLIKEQFAATLVLFVIVGILNGLGSAVMFGTFLTFPFGLLVLTVAFEKLTGHTEGA